MKVLVTGGSGRAGKYVIKDLLENGHSVVNADMINGYLEDRNPELSFKKLISLTTDKLFLQQKIVMR